MRSANNDPFESAQSRHTLEVLALAAGSFEPVAEHHGDASLRACPFDAIELGLRALWI